MMLNKNNMMSNKLLFVCVLVAVLFVIPLTACDSFLDKEDKSSSGQAWSEEPEEPKKTRMEIVEKWKDNWWTYKIIRDTETEKEWLMIYDSTRITVVPLDGSEPIASNNN